LIAVPAAENGKRGRKPTMPHADIQPITIDEYAKSLRKNQYKEVRIRPTTKGWLTALIHVARFGCGIKNLRTSKAQRFWIERCFRDSSHDLGMFDYQVRTYKGFFNHMALTSVALEWVLKERLANTIKIPQLSVNDIRTLIAKEIRSKFADNYKENRGKQLEKRHRQRQMDINRYYNEPNLPK
jgi:hypothetical protein